MRRRSILLRRAAFVAAAGLAFATACGDEAPTPSTADAAPLDASAAGDGGRADADVEDITCERVGVGAATVPAAYAGRKNPLGADANAVARGRTTYDARCALCHGAAGRGDGPEGPSDPRPADLTTPRRVDDYLFWRISAGGRIPPFCSAMPAFDYLPESVRWELVSLVQSLEPQPPRDAGPEDAAPE